MKDFVIVDSLIKKYGELTAVDNLSFTVKEGEIFGLLGPNGAGKSTTMNILTTLFDFNGGKVTIKGFDVIKDTKSVKGIIGLVPQDISVYNHLTAIENVKFFASLYGVKGKDLDKSAKEALEFVGLSDKHKLKPGQMSGGMKRRLNIACGIAHNPELIIMDEPTVGVDAQSREHILDSIRILKERGATVIYTSHYMQEVEDICDRIAIIDKGKLVSCGTKEELVSIVTDVKSFVIETTFKSTEKAEKAKSILGSIPGVKNVIIEDNKIKLDVLIESDSLPIIVTEISKLSLPVHNINSEVPNLETMFLTLTGHELR